MCRGKNEITESCTGEHTGVLQRGFGPAPRAANGDTHGLVEFWALGDHLVALFRFHKQEKHIILLTKPESRDPCVPSQTLVFCFLVHEWVAAVRAQPVGNIGCQSQSLCVLGCVRSSRDTSTQQVRNTHYAETQAKTHKTTKRVPNAKHSCQHRKKDDCIQNRHRRPKVEENIKNHAKTETMRKHVENIKHSFKTPKALKNIRTRKKPWKII